MLRSFRNISQKLAAENLPDRQAGKVMAYLRYAIGENLLVVVRSHFNKINVIYIPMIKA